MSAAHERRSHRAEAVVSLALALGAAVLSGLIAAHPGARPAEGEARVLLVAPSSMAPVAAHERTTRPGAPRWQVVSAPRPARPGSTQADLAIVDGVALDLDEEEVEAGSSPERRARLRRDAIDFEIVRRAAVEEGVALAPEQRRALDRLWGEATTRDARVADRVGLDPAAAERDLRPFETRMLLEAIAAGRGLPPRHVDGDRVLAYYAEHARELPPLPDGEGRARAWRAVEIEIRSRLAREVAADHERGLAELLAELRAAASVVPPAP